MGSGHLTAILSNIGVFITIFIINKVVFLYYLICSGILVLINIIKSEKFNEKNRLYRISQDKVSSLTGELVRGVRDIKMLNASDSFMIKLNEATEDMSQKIFDARGVDMGYNVVIDIIKHIMSAGAIYLLVFLITHNAIDTAMAVVLFSYKDRVLTSLLKPISDLLEQTKEFNLSCSRVFELIDGKKYKKEKFGKTHLDKVSGNFKFDKVTFGYSEDRSILNNLSFEVKAGTTVGFVGKTGAGKSTIFSLLCKLYDVEKGKILIDNKPIEELDEESIRGNITIISQSPYIFNMSIKDNLRLVTSDVTDEEIKEACKLACLDEFINKLPNKYDTVVGEGGVSLSGGQRQRLAIARAFIQKTKIILFDEATSALDNETQSNIQQVINNLKGEYTILIIAHRLSTIVNCDNILVLEDGQVKESGTHKELLKTSKFYKKLYETEITE